MKALKTLFFLYLIGCFFISCQKSDNVNGTVTNFYTGEPIIGAFVFVEKFLPNAGEEGSINTLATTKTDENGNFSLRVSRKRMRNEYKIICEKGSPMSDENYLEAYFFDFPLSIGNSKFELDDSKNQTVHFTLIPTSRIKFSINLFETDHSGDSLAAFVYGENFNLPIFKYPTQVIETLNRRKFVPSNGKVLLYVYTRKKGLVAERTDTIVVKQFEKADYLIKF